MATHGLPLDGIDLTEAISAEMVDLYGRFYNHDRTTATTYINDNVVVCILEDILSDGESVQIAAGGSGDVLDGRVAFQVGAEDEFTAAVERLTGRTVTAFMSANQTSTGIASELFFLDGPPGGDAVATEPAPERDDLSDEVLMGRAQTGDTDAFASLYDRHAERAFRVARAICRDRGRAEDAVQEGFLAIWRSRDSFRTVGGSFKAWAMRIVRNRAIDATRRAAVRPPVQIEEAETSRPQVDIDAASPPDLAIARSEREVLLASIAQLPDAQAEVIVLAYYGELTHSEIAAQLELPPGTVKGRMRLGLEKLRFEMATAEDRQEPD